MSKPARKIVRCIHNGRWVHAREDLVGRHDEHSLCLRCDKFVPGSDDNCKIANILNAVRVQFALAAPVYECAAFEEKK